MKQCKTYTIYPHKKNSILCQANELKHQINELKKTIPLIKLTAKEEYKCGLYKPTH